MKIITDLRFPIDVRFKIYKRLINLAPKSTFFGILDIVVTQKLISDSLQVQATSYKLQLRMNNQKCTAGVNLVTSIIYPNMAKNMVYHAFLFDATGALGWWNSYKSSP